jgi:hypothetical protein
MSDGVSRSCLASVDDGTDERLRRQRANELHRILPREREERAVLGDEVHRHAVVEHDHDAARTAELGHAARLLELRARGGEHDEPDEEHS